MRYLLLLLALSLTACTTSRGRSGDGGDDDDAAGDDDDAAGDDDDATGASVEITSPEDGASVCGQVTLQASGSASIVAVLFELDGDELDRVDAPPFEVVWDTTEVADGDHTLSVVGSSDSGPSAEDSIDVTVGNDGDCDNAPSITILAPLDGAGVSGEVEIDVSAQDDDGVVRVDFFVDSGLLLADEAVPFGATFLADDFDEGAHTLRAVATDTAGQTADDEVTVVIDRTGPSLAFDLPAANAQLHGVVDVVLAVNDASDIAEVSLYSSTGLVGSRTSPPWTFEWDTTADTSGDHTLEAEAVDAAGNPSTETRDVTVDQLPTGAWTAPSGDVEDATALLSVSAADDVGVDAVTFSLGAATIGEALAPPYEAVWDVCADGDGSHDLLATIVDTLGQSLELELTVLVALDDSDGDGSDVCEDCDDTASGVHPGAVEVCDGIDTDCDGGVPADEADADGDGWLVCEPVGPIPGIDGGGDCDDSDPSRSPGAADIANDGIDQDCDGADYTPVASAGDLVITEFLKNPNGDDLLFEWIELYNPTANAVQMQGFVLSDLGTDSHTISASLVVQPGDYVVLGGSTDPLANGSAPVDYAYGGDFILGNGADEIELHDPTGQLVDSLYYDDGNLWPDPAGWSVNLDPSQRDAASNNFSTSWCTSTASDFGTNGDGGTPGAPNHPC